MTLDIWKSHEVDLQMAVVDSGDGVGVADLDQLQGESPEAERDRDLVAAHFRRWRWHP